MWPQQATEDGADLCNDVEIVPSSITPADCTSCGKVANSYQPRFHYFSFGNTNETCAASTCVCVRIPELHQLTLRMDKNVVINVMHMGVDIGCVGGAIALEQT